MGGKLTVLKIFLEKLKRSAKLDDNEVEQFRNAMDMLDDSVQEMRRVSHNLMPDTLNHAGLKPAVDDFCRSMSSQIVFNYYGDETRLDLKLEALIYRCISELVNNALKYAGASEIMVQIIREADSVSFTVQDNGCGFDPTAETKGIGLQNIRTRVASFGGDIQIDSKVGEGTEINVEFVICNS
jgi:signal transduction histidine kinase